MQDAPEAHASSSVRVGIILFTLGAQAQLRSAAEVLVSRNIR